MVLRKRVEDYATPLDLMSRPLTWDTEGVFSESKNLVFIDRLIAATANGNKGTYIQNTDDLAEWTLYAEGSKKKMVSIRLKDGQVHVHPDFDREYLKAQRVERELARIARGRMEIGRKIQGVEWDLSHGIITEEHRRNLIDSERNLKDQLDELDRGKKWLELIRDLRTMKVDMVLSTKIGGVKIDVKRIGKFLDPPLTP